MEWSIGDIVRATGTTSRTLRHYDRIGLLPPTRTGPGGYRFYDQAALLRLQRILLLRELGLGLSAIGETLEDGQEPVSALREHLGHLARERGRLDRLIATVQSTITTLEAGEPLVATQAFDGFDHTQHREEVEQRWGSQAYADSDRWWRSLSDADKQGFRDRLDSLIEDFAVASARGQEATSEHTQALAQRQYDWISAGWGGTPPSAEAFTALGQMYVDDPRFGATYEVDGRSFAAYVRDAMAVYAERNLA